MDEELIERVEQIEMIMEALTYETLDLKNKLDQIDEEELDREINNEGRQNSLSIPE